jgi:hypothetical protein
MTFASVVLKRASGLLFDEDFARWSLLELADWLDEGVKALVSVKPSASSHQVELSLVRGTKQTLPSGSRIVQLLDILRNAGGSNGSAGRAIRPTTRSELDSNEPRWHDAACVPFRREVRQYVHDPALPDEFYVYPGNDGTGRVLAAVSVLPESVVSRLKDDPNVLTTWNIEIGVSEQYDSALLDYVLYRANLKEDTAAAPARATLHYQAFAGFLGYQAQAQSTSGKAGGG